MLVTHVRRLGPHVIASELRRRAASKEVNLGLRADLGRLPELRPARIPLTLEPADGAFAGFAAELERARGADYGRALRRLRLHEAGVRTMYAAFDDRGAPVYVQWLVTPEDQPLLERHAGDTWPPLQAGEVLLEYAYTFTDHR